MKTNIHKIIRDMKNALPLQVSRDQQMSRIITDTFLDILEENNDLVEDQNELLEKSYEALLHNNAYQVKRLQLDILQAKRDVLQTEMKYLLAQRGTDQYKRLRDQLDAIDKQIMDMEI